VRFLVDKELEGIECSKFDSVKPTQSIRSTAVVELEVDEESQKVDSSDGDIGS